MFGNQWAAYTERTANISTNFIVEGLQEQMQQLDKLLASNPEMEKRMQKVIRNVLMKAHKKMCDELHSDPALTNDPRNAYKAVKTAVYRRILGGNINILNKKRRGAATSYTPTRTLKAGQRGGNRMSRSERTHRMDSYDASDRGFILRFLNSGTRDRVWKGFTTDPHRKDVKRGSQGGNLKKYGNIANVNTGNRGKIHPRNIFASKLISLGSFIDEQLERTFAELYEEVIREND